MSPDMQIGFASELGGEFYLYHTSSMDLRQFNQLLDEYHIGMAL